MQTTIKPADTFREALIVQSRVVAALMLRETRTRYGKLRIGYAWALISPILQIASMTIAWTVLGRAARVGTSIPVFFATGCMAFIMFRRVAQQCGSALATSKGLLAFPIVKPLDFLIARAVTETLTSIACLLIIFAGLIVFLGEPTPTAPHWILLSTMLLSILGFGYGTLTAVLSEWAPAWRSIEGFASRPLIIASGAIIPPENLPPWLLEYVVWNPVLHGVELMRYGYYWQYRSDLLDVGYLAKCTLVLLFLGLVVERANRFRPLADD